MSEQVNVEALKKTHLDKLQQFKIYQVLIINKLLQNFPVDLPLDLSELITENDKLITSGIPTLKNHTYLKKSDDAMLKAEVKSGKDVRSHKFISWGNDEELEPAFDPEKEIIDAEIILGRSLTVEENTILIKTYHRPYSETEITDLILRSEEEANRYESMVNVEIADQFQKSIVKCTIKYLVNERLIRISSDLNGLSPDDAIEGKKFKNLKFTLTAKVISLLDKEIDIIVNGSDKSEKKKDTIKNVLNGTFAFGINSLAGAFGNSINLGEVFANINSITSAL
tara:strand:+ start:323 stop:1168 length:846 start_codon:yes stop_codon:yes gene_type:complete